MQRIALKDAIAEIGGIAEMEIPQRPSESNASHITKFRTLKLQNQPKTLKSEKPKLVVPPAEIKVNGPRENAISSIDDGHLIAENPLPWGKSRNSILNDTKLSYLPKTWTKTDMETGEWKSYEPPIPKKIPIVEKVPKCDAALRVKPKVPMAKMPKRKMAVLSSEQFVESGGIHTYVLYFELYSLWVV